jgi:hypothetical protein
VPFVWIGNVISNPGANPNLFPTGPQRPTRKGSTLAQSFDVNAMDPDFKWPQTWTTNVAVEKALPWATRGVFEVLYAKDLNAVFMRNADLVAPVRTLPDGRPFYGGSIGGANERNPDGGAGIYVIDNTDKGYSLNLTTQLRKGFGEGSAGLAYSYTHAKNTLKSTEIASVLWQNQPVQGNPNTPELSNSEFGQRNRIIGDATYVKRWSARHRTQFGAFLEVAEGNVFAGNGGNRYSFLYSGDVNGDGASGNDLIYIPRTQTEVILVSYTTSSGSVVSPAEQWTRFDAFINQDPYLKEHRGQIAERFGLLNPWYSSLDARVLHDVSFARGGQDHTLQLSLDVMNLGNLINSHWGVRKIADPSATSPLSFAGFNGAGAPTFNFTGPARTFIDDPSLGSRWQAQLGAKYFFK